MDEEGKNGDEVNASKLTESTPRSTLESNLAEGAISQNEMVALDTDLQNEFSTLENETENSHAQYSQVEANVTQEYLENEAQTP